MTRTRVAAFTPGPPLGSGGAVYAGTLLPELARHLDVVAVSPDPIDWDGPTIAPDDVRADRFDMMVHFLGDNPEHLFAYCSALRWGGVVVCHDLMFPHLLGRFAPDEEALDLAEHLGPGPAGELLGRRARRVASHDEVYLLQVTARPLRQAEAIVVHSRFAQFMVEAELPGVPVHHVPSHTGAVPADLGDQATARAELGLPADAFLVGLFGILAGHKRVTEALAGIARAVPAARRHGVDLGVVAVGADVAPAVTAELARLGLDPITVVRQGVDDRSFFLHMAAVDVVVGLRYPTLGETSATVIQAMHLGKPVITTAHAQFAEEPAAVLVPPDHDEAERVADAIVALATCDHCRSRAAEASRATAARHTLAAATAAYVRVVESTLARRLSPRVRP